jgi:hypothetical protein
MRRCVCSVYHNVGDRLCGRARFLDPTSSHHLTYATRRHATRHVSCPLGRGLRIAATHTRYLGALLYRPPFLRPIHLPSAVQTTSSTDEEKTVRATGRKQQQYEK